MSALAYPVLIELLPAEGGGGYLATVPDLPGCMSDGETTEEAVVNVQDAIATWIEGAGRMGHAAPPPTSYDPDCDRWPARASLVMAG